MRVDHVGPPMTHHSRPAHRDAAVEREAERATERVQAQNLTRARNGDQTASLPDGKDQEGHVKGVIRLLEQGHFKGVADVRLRINFFEELSQRATARATESLPEEAQALVATVDQKARELIDTLELDPDAEAAMIDALAAFDEQVNGAVTAQVESGQLSLESLSDALQAAFGELVQRIAEILQPPVEDPGEQDEDVNEGEDAADNVSGEGPGAAGDDAGVANVLESPAEGIAAADEDDAEIGDPQESAPDPEEPSLLSVEEALAELQAAFDEALNTLINQLQTSLDLGEPSPPNGNGVAYDKFLAIYHDLLNGNAAPEPEDTAVDQTI